MDNETVGGEVAEGAEVVAAEGAVAEPENAAVVEAETAAPAVAAENSVRKTWGALEYALVVNSCATAAEVSKITGLTIPVVHSKSSSLRKKGVKIKNFQRGGGKGRAKLDYAAINAALDSATSPE